MGCLNKFVKRTLFATNLLIFILGAAVLGLGIWSLLDKPSILGITEKAKEECKGDGTCEEGLAFFNKISSASYILIAISALILIIAFFGCCGAYMENKCMLGTYFTIILVLFIAMVVGAVLILNGNLEKPIKEGLKEELKKYNDNDNTDTTQEKVSKIFWNFAQEKLKCCGVNNVTDWTKTPDQFDFKSGFDKPEGCCKHARDEEEPLDESKIEECRKSKTESTESTKYYFRGCYTFIKEEIEDNTGLLVGVAIGAIIFMFISMLFSFALCTMV